MQKKSVAKNSGLEKQSIIDLLRIVRTKNVSINDFYLFYKIYKDFSKIIDNLSVHFKNAKRKLQICTEKEAEKEYQEVLEFGASFVTFLDENYPQSLKKNPNYPPVLIVKGNLNLLQKKEIIAIVGARNTTIAGTKMAEKFTYELGKKSIANISGFAKGIDTAVHSTSVEHNLPTIAVFGCGIDVIYPVENKTLYKEILQKKGLLISIFPFSAPVYPYNFPARNRIIAGMANFGTLVIEASKKSGTLITARYALDYGYDVFAIPGSPLDKHFAGTNYLIKNGAKLVESTEDILRENHFLSDRYIEKDDFLSDSIKSNYENLNFETDEQELPDAKEQILNSLSFVPTSIDEIIKYTGIYTSTVLISLLELSLEDKIQWCDGRKVILNIKY